MTLTTAALDGLRVIEMGQLIAGPFAGKTLGEFGADVSSARWDEASRRWLLRTSAGEFRARVLVSAAGALADAETAGLAKIILPGIA